MIFNWEEEFDEKTLKEGLDLEDSVMDLDVGFELIYAWVEDNYVNIALSDDFKIESLECECGEKKCRHMTAVLYASENSFKKDAEYELFLDDLDSDKLLEFLKEMITYNDEVLDEFKDRFRNDIIVKGDMYPELRLYIILEDIFFHDNLNTFIENDLMKSYREDKRECIYLIASMFSNLIDAYSFDEPSKMKSSWMRVEDLIIRLYDDLPEIVYNFLDDLKKTSL